MRRSAAFSPPSRSATHASARRRPSWSGVDDRPPDRLLHLDRLVLPAGDVDRLRRALDLPRAELRPVGEGVARDGLEHHEVGPVALAVREAPRDPAVAADDHEGRPGQRHAGHASLAARRAVDERRTVPGVRDRDPEVHVVRHDRAAVGRVRAAHRPVVAAVDDRFLARARRRAGRSRVPRDRPGRRCRRPAPTRGWSPGAGRGRPARGWTAERTARPRAARPTRCLSAPGTRRAEAAGRRASRRASTPGRAARPAASGTS